MIFSPCSVDELPASSAACCRGQDVDVAHPHQSKHSQRYSHSRLLQDVQNIRRAANSTVDLPFASEIVELWMKYCDSASHSGCAQTSSLFSTDQLSCILQVASFLQDDRSLADAAESMARLVGEHLVRDESAAHDQPWGLDTGTCPRSSTPIPKHH